MIGRIVKPPATDARLQYDREQGKSTDLRPHRALHGATPQAASDRRVKARPAPLAAATHFRVRTDGVSKAGNVTLRYLSQLRHIGLGKAHAGEPVRLLVADALRARGARGRLAAAGTHHRRQS